jgi:hypothetical protein
MRSIDEYDLSGVIINRYVLAELHYVLSQLEFLFFAFYSVFSILFYLFSILNTHPFFFASKWKYSVDFMN